MEDENLLPQDGMNPELEVAEDTTEGTGQIQDDEDIESLKQRLADADEAKRQLTARAKKAEDALKRGIQAKPQPSINTNALSEETVEIMLLKTQGMDPELIEELKVIAKARGKGLIDTQKDPIFIAVKNQREVDSKAQKAKLGASRGSGSVKKEKTISSAGLTSEEHKELWSNQNGQ